MKTKFLFTMCAATLLVACTNEEFISTPENNLADRAKVNVMLGAEMGGYTIGDASTRTIWESGKYKWEASDVLGACMVDAKTLGTPEYNNIVSNYPFTPVEAITTPVESANFKTNTAVYEGTYVFYHGYQANMTKGRKITVNFPASQELDADKPYAHLTADNFFVSPLIKIKDGIAFEANNTIPVQFTSLYSGFAPTLKNTSSKDVKVSKIEVYSAVGFKLGGDINTVASAFGTIVGSDNEDLKNAIGEKVEVMRSADKDLYETAVTSGNNMVSITLPDMTIAAGASQEIRMLFPAGSYNQNDLTMKVYTDRGVFETKANPGSTPVKFNRDVFKTNTYEMSKFEYPAEFKIFNKKDWEYAVRFIQSNDYYKNHAVTFELQADIELTETADIPAFSVYVNANSHKLTLNKENATFNLAQDSYIGALEVAKGTTLNLDGTSFINSLTNKGTVAISGNVASKDAKADYLAWTDAGAKYYGISTLANNGQIEVNGTLELGANATLNAGSEITNNGTLAIVDDVTNNGKIINNKLLTVADSKTLTNNKDIVLGENCKVQCLGGSAASIITNNNAAAIITLAAVKDVFVDNTGAATSTALVTNTLGVTSVAITATSDLAALQEIQEVNSATISGNWAKAAIDKVDAATTITNLILENATIDLNDVSTSFNNVTNIIVNGTPNAINNSSSIAQQLAIKTTTLTISEGAKLSIAKNVKFGKIDATNVATITVLGELENSGTVLGNITVGAAAAAPIPANTSAIITNNEDAILTAGSAIAATNVTMAKITNFGTVANYGTLYTTTVENQIASISVFQGNVTKTSATVSEAGF